MKYIVKNCKASIFELMEKAAPAIAAYGVDKKIDVDIKRGCLMAVFSPLASYMGRLDKEELEETVRNACIAYGKFNKSNNASFGFTINGTEVAIATDRKAVDCFSMLENGDTVRKAYGVNFFTLTGSFPGKANIGFVAF